MDTFINHPPCLTSRFDRPRVMLVSTSVDVDVALGLNQIESDTEDIQCLAHGDICLSV